MWVDTEPSQGLPTLRLWVHSMSSPVTISDRMSLVLPAETLDINRQVFQ